MPRKDFIASQGCPGNFPPHFMYSTFVVTLPYSSTERNTAPRGSTLNNSPEILILHSSQMYCIQSRITDAGRTYTPPHFVPTGKNTQDVRKIYFTFVIVKIGQSCTSASVSFKMRRSSACRLRRDVIIFHTYTQICVVDDEDMSLTLLHQLSSNFVA